MIDIEALKATWQTGEAWRRSSAHGKCCIDIEALIKEVEELRGLLTLHEKTCGFVRLHEAKKKIFSHWLAVAAERMASGEPEGDTLRDYGYVRAEAVATPEAAGYARAIADVVGMCERTAELDERIAETGSDINRVEHDAMAQTARSIARAARGYVPDAKGTGDGPA